MIDASSDRLEAALSANETLAPRREAPIALLRLAPATEGRRPFGLHRLQQIAPGRDDLAGRVCSHSISIH